MEGKMHRYMQRIEKIITTPNRHHSPLRPSHSPLRCRANQLDRYIKFELSARIITKLIDKHHSQLANLFFSRIRQTQHMQRERVYKFVAIQRQTLKVDLTISAKLLASVFKDLVKKKYLQSMQALHQVETNRESEEKSKGEIGLIEQRERRNTMKSAVEARNLGKGDRTSFKVPEWSRDGESSKGHTKSVNSSKRDRIRAKLVQKILESKVHHALLASFTTVKDHSRKKEVKASEERYQKEKDILLKEINALKKQRQGKNRDSSSVLIDSSKDNKGTADKWVLNFINQYFMKQKLQLSKYLQLTAVCLKGRAKEELLQAKLFKKSSSVTLFGLIFQNKLKNCWKQISQKASDCKRVKFNYQCFAMFTCQLLLKVKHKNSAFFWNRIVKLHFQQLKNQSVDVPVSVQPFSEDNSSMESYSPTLGKLTFYSFVDKIFKFILIVSKLLIPIKEAFLKIDLYASYSYRLEESLTVVPQKILREAFQSIKTLKTQDKKLERTKTFEVFLQKTSSIVVQRLVEPFSRLKVLSRDNQLSVQLMPIQANIIELTRQFISDRNNESQHSLDYWTIVKNSFLHESNSSQDLEPKSKKQYSAQ